MGGGWHGRHGRHGIAPSLNPPLAIGGITANWEFRPPKFPLSVGRPGPLSNTALLGTTQVSLPNGISFPPTALARCTNVTDRQTDGRTTRGYICRNRRIAYAFSGVAEQWINSDRFLTTVVTVSDTLTKVSSNVLINCLNCLPLWSTDNNFSSVNGCDHIENEYHESINQASILLSITSSNIDSFSKFFHRHVQQEIWSANIPPYLNASLHYLVRYWFQKLHRSKAHQRHTKTDALKRMWPW